MDKSNSFTEFLEHVRKTEHTISKAVQWIFKHYIGIFSINDAVEHILVAKPAPSEGLTLSTEYQTLRAASR